MKNNNIIKDLSKQDKKTLSQKALKIMEELGELSEVILPFENASGTIHRFVDRNHLLEECADLYLTVKSIVYSMDFTDDEFDDMVMHKTKKWADLQKAEAKVQGKIPYEIHVTVEQANKEQFIADCKELGVKPVILALQNDFGVLTDVMTSSVFMGNNRTAYDEMKRISDGLWVRGHEIVREKIETVPWHPAAPTEDNNAPMPEDCYFETHIGIIVPSEHHMGFLRELAQKHNAHLSRNAFKLHTDGTFTQMMTLRKYTGTYEDFEVDASALETEIRKIFEIEKRVTEFSIYDTKVSHDSAWLTDEESTKESTSC